MANDSRTKDGQLAVTDPFAPPVVVLTPPATDYRDHRPERERLRAHYPDVARFQILS